MVMVVITFEEEKVLEYEEERVKVREMVHYQEPVTSRSPPLAAVPAIRD